MSDNILVAVRVRSLITRELNAQELPLIHWQVHENNTIVQVDPDSKKCINSFMFDKLYGETVLNNEIYQEVASPIIEAAITGINGTIFAYGQTSSGKTYTMSGDGECFGIIQTSIQNIFYLIENTPDREYLLRVSYMEIYQETIYDLITGKKITSVREDPSGNVYVPGLEEICVTNEDELLNVMANGNKKRKVAETNMNDRSSRSHSIFRLIIESRETTDKDCDGAVTVSHLNLVDLAGSENASQTGATGERLREGSSINKSLFMLGRVISQLSEGESHVNFRDSKLTRILQASLGGNAKTVIICTVTPASREQTLSTVRFAGRAKSIKNKPIVNEVLSEAALLKRYAVEIKKLKTELEKEKKTDKAQEVEQVKEKLDEQEKRNFELHQKIKNLQEKLVVSSHSGVGNVITKKEKRLRRETWAAPVGRPLSRLSHFGSKPLSTLLELPSPNFTDSPISISSVSSSSNSFVELSDSKLNVLFRLDEEMGNNLNDNGFLSPSKFPKKLKKRNKVNFFENSLSLCKMQDVQCQTDDLPHDQTRKSTLDDDVQFQICDLERKLQANHKWLDDWNAEMEEMKDYHKLELKSIKEEVNEGKIEITKLNTTIKDLKEENDHLAQSLEDAEHIVYGNLSKSTYCIENLPDDELSSINQSHLISTKVFESTMSQSIINPFDISQRLSETLQTIEESFYTSNNKNMNSGEVEAIKQQLLILQEALMNQEEQQLPMQSELQCKLDKVENEYLLLQKKYESLLAKISDQDCTKIIKEVDDSNNDSVNEAVEEQSNTQQYPCLEEVEEQLLSIQSLQNEFCLMLGNRSIENKLSDQESKEFHENVLLQEEKYLKLRALIKSQSRTGDSKIPIITNSNHSHNSGEELQNNILETYNANASGEQKIYVSDFNSKQLINPNGDSCMNSEDSDLLLKLQAAESKRDEFRDKLSLLEIEHKKLLSSANDSLIKSEDSDLHLKLQSAESERDKITEKLSLLEIEHKQLLSSANDSLIKAEDSDLLLKLQSAESERDEIREKLSLLEIEHKQLLSSANDSLIKSEDSDLLLKLQSAESERDEIREKLSLLEIEHKQLLSSANDSLIKSEDSDSLLKLQSAESERDEFRDKLSLLEIEHKQLLRSNDDSRIKLEHLLQQLKSAENERLLIKERFSSLELELNELILQKSSCEAENERILSNLNLTAKELIRLEENCKKLECNNYELEKNNVELEMKLQSRSVALNAGEEAMNLKKSELEQSLCELHKLNQEKIIAQTLLTKQEEDLNLLILKNEELSMKLSLLSEEHLKVVNELKDNVTRLDTDKKTLIKLVEKLELKISSEKEALSDKDVVINNLEARVNSLLSGKEKTDVHNSQLEAQMNEMKTKLNELTNNSLNLEVIQKKNAELIISKNDLANEIIRFKKIINDLTIANSSFKKQIEAISLDCKCKHEELLHEQKLFKQIVADKEQLSTKTSKLYQELNSVKEEKIRIEDKLKSTQKEKDNLKNMLDDETKAFKQFKLDNSEQSTHVSTLNSQLLTLHKDLRSLNEKYSNVCLVHSTCAEKLHHKEQIEIKLNQTVKTLSKDLHALQITKQELQSNCKKAQINSEKLSATIESQSTQLINLQTNFKSLKCVHEKLNENYELLEKKLNEVKLTSSPRLEKHQYLPFDDSKKSDAALQEVKNLKDDLQGLQNRYDELREKYDLLANELKETEFQKENLKTTLAENEAQFSRNPETDPSNLSLVDKLKEELMDQQEKFNIIDKNYDLLEEEIMEADKYKANMEKIMMEKDNYLQSLEQIIENNKLKSPVENMRIEESNTTDSASPSSPKKDTEKELNKFDSLYRKNENLTSRYDQLEKKFNVLQEVNQKLSQSLKKKTTSALDSDSKTQDADSKSSNIHKSDLTDEVYYDLKRRYVLLEMENKALKDPIKKEVEDTKALLEREKAEKEHWIRELRRVQHNDMDASIRELKPAKSNKKASESEDPDNFAHCGSGFVTQFQVLRLENKNYHLEKQKAECEKENMILKSHVDHYKLKAREWKTKCLKEQSKSGNTMTSPNKKEVREDIENSQPGQMQSIVPTKHEIPHERIGSTKKAPESNPKDVAQSTSVNKDVSSTDETVLRDRNKLPAFKPTQSKSKCADRDECRQQ